MNAFRIALCALCLTPAALNAQAVISNGSTSVTVHESGVIIGVPDDGLLTTDGPQVLLVPGTAEWFGLAFQADGVAVTAVASGSENDWAGRTPVELVSFTAAADTAVSVTRAGDMLIRTDFSFDPDGPWMISGVTLTNTGDGWMRNVLYSREWSVTAGRGFTFPYDILGVADAPDRIARRLWMFDDMPPGGSAGAGVGYGPPAMTTGSVEGAGGVDVPLSLWTDATWPTGLVVGATNGISFGDFDADGYTDIFACKSGNLWRNVNGQTWVLAADLDSVLPFTARRYGSAFGDYDKDGLPDIGTEPRDGWGGDECFHLLHALDALGSYEDVAIDPLIVDLQPCNSDAETICWGDVDGDTNLDMFLPVYPAWAFGGPGNFFLYNLGPTGPGGAYHFTEISGPVGVDNVPPSSARPEGAQFVDTDFDGDMDLYVSGHLYQNNSTPGAPSFTWMTQAASGIRLGQVLEEGAMFFDYDLDGDQDLAIVYTPSSRGVKIWENFGDGSFFEVEDGVIDSPKIGLDLGMSAEDWDNDGDIDFTTRQVFRRNQLVETGQRKFTVATHNIPSNHITSATPAWGDWDHDGDLDCALGNWLSAGHFYENTLYDEATPDEDRRYVRVRVMRDDPVLARGTETEYAANVEIRVHGDTSGFRRRKFTSSSAGYINQSEYVLTFALPADPTPGDPATDLLFDVSVDFPHIGDLWRVDRSVNPLLGSIALADLTEREITVFRSGRVVIDGCDSVPVPAGAPELTTTAGGLALAAPTVALLGMTPAPGPDHFVGLSLDTGPEAVRLEEIQLDGQLDAVVSCAGDANMFVWDVTDAGSPFLVTSGLIAETTSDRNHRSHFPVDVVLAGSRKYRIVARVTELRASAFAGPLAEGGMTVNGGLSYTDAAPCTGAAVEAAVLDAAALYVAVRVSLDLGGPWTDMGAALAGSAGEPQLDSSGTLLPGSTVTLTLTAAKPTSDAWLIIGRRRVCQPFKGGSLVPSSNLILGPFRTDLTGTLVLAGTWPGGVPPGTTLYYQHWIDDAVAPAGLAASNAVSGTTPF